MGLTWTPAAHATTMAIANRTSDGYTSRFGMIRWRTSIIAAASITPRKGAIRAATPYGNRKAAAANSAAVDASTNGYSTEMGSPQFRQRPRRSRYEMTGTLSQGRM